MSPVTWIGTCRNPGDGRDYLVSYNDCCGKGYCGRCFCNRNEGDRPIYYPHRSNDINWCAGASTNVYHCSTAIVLGVAASRRSPRSEGRARDRCWPASPRAAPPRSRCPRPTTRSSAAAATAPDGAGVPGHVPLARRRRSAARDAGRAAHACSRCRACASRRSPTSGSRALLEWVALRFAPAEQRSHASRAHGGRGERGSADRASCSACSRSVSAAGARRRSGSPGPGRRACAARSPPACAAGGARRASPLVRPNARAALALAALAAVVFAWWGSLTPSNSRDWQPDVSRAPTAEIDGDLVTVQERPQLPLPQRDRLRRALGGAPLRPREARAASTSSSRTGARR